MRELPEGFKPIGEDAPVQVPAVEVVEYARWSQGATVLYQGLVELSPEEPTDRSKVHTVRGPTAPADGKLYGLWRCQSLDRALRLVRIGDLVFLRYEGKRPHPTMQGSEVHEWTVARDSSQPVKPAGQAKGLPADLK